MPANNPHDPFDLAGKNLRRVVPQIHKNIKIQRARVTGHLVTFLMLLFLGAVGVQTKGIFLGIGAVCVLISPISLIGLFADHHLMRYHQRRLAECQRRLEESTD